MKKYKAVFIFIICALLAAPALYMFGLSETIGIFGKEVITPLPNLHDQSFKNKQFQKQFEEWWQSHFFGRRHALKSKNQLYDWFNLGQMHSGYDNGIIQGKNRYLFEKGYFYTLTECLNFPPELQQMQKLAAIMRKLNIELYYISAPNKVETYPEFMPRQFAYFCRHNCDYSGKTVQYLDSIGIRNFNSQPLMKQIKQNEDYQPFTRTGTHWNLYGSGRTLQEAAKKFGWSKIIFKDIEHSETKFFAERDIADLLNLWDKYDDDHDFIRPVYEKAEKVLEGTTVLIGNSFSNEMKNALLDSGLVEQKHLIHIENRPMTDDDIKQIRRSSRIILVYTDTAVINSGHQFYKKLEKMVTELPYFVKEDFAHPSGNLEISGLSGIGDWGRWSDGDKTVIKFDAGLNPYCNDYDIKFDFKLNLFLHEKRPQQKVKVYLNDEPIAEWLFELGKARPVTSFTVPYASIKNGKAVLTFEIDNPQSPFELGVSKDKRKLAIGFVSMDVYVAD